VSTRVQKRSAIPEELKAIRGAQELYDWFGYWPPFMDAEVIALHLNRRGTSSLMVHTYEMTDRTDDIGYYVLEKHVVVEFILEDIAELNLSGFTRPNVVSSLMCEKIPRGYRLTLDAYYGLGGTIDARAVSIRLHPGEPREKA
jgi:hypothetical protein